VKAVDHVRRIVRLTDEFFEDRWFDLTRNVRTSGDTSLLAAGIAADDFHDSEYYVPARPRHIRQALREMPVQDVTGFSYVDLGSGKGRTLFVAAELPFKQIIGVELSCLLHQQACANIRSFRSSTQGCRHITSLHQNAKDFTFPEGHIVLYLFNPFGSATMQCVLNNLKASLQRRPCHIIIILLWPRCGDQVAAIEGMHLRRETRQYQIFEVHTS
jgi:SAM-dependent methyltransferase